MKKNSITIPIDKKEKTPVQCSIKAPNQDHITELRDVLNILQENSENNKIIQ